MDSFLLLCFIPITIAIGARLYFQYEITWKESAIQITVGIIAVAILCALATRDTEVINGTVTEKVRNHGHYVESYSCRCRSVKSGNSTTTRCDTCYRDHYTVTWYLKSTIGDISIAKKDQTSRSVYFSSDPLGGISNPMLYTMRRRTGCPRIPISLVVQMIGISVVVAQYKEPIR